MESESSATGNTINFFDAEYEPPTEDSYHTMNELYEHRNILFCSLLNCLSELAEHNADYFQVRAWKSQKHEDGSMFDDMFIAGARLYNGDEISYHLPNAYWESLGMVAEIPNAPHWDGYTPADVLTRLSTFCAPF